MRHLTIHVDRGQGDNVIDIAHEHKAFGMTTWEADSPDRQIDMISLHISNSSMGGLIVDLEKFSGLSVSFQPDEVITFIPPAEEAPERVTNLEPRSPPEVYLYSLQSLGEWSSFVTFVVAGAVVVWIAFLTNSIFLLLAAMLISPFAGPAMNVALSTAVGVRRVLLENLTRYVAAIGITALVTGLLAHFFQENVTTGLMISIGRISSVSFLLPLVAGVAGALNVVQSERSSLVNGSAVGIFVAASLAPPAGLIGITLALGMWNLALSAAFSLALQLAGINLAGSIVFRIYGLTPSLQRYSPGKKWMFYLSLLGSLAALTGLLAWQFSQPLQLERSSEGAQAAQTVQEIIRNSGLAEPVEVEARFPEPEPEGSRTLLVTGFIKPITAENQPEDIEKELEILIEQRLKEKNTGVVLLVDLTVIEPPP